MEQQEQITLGKLVAQAAGVKEEEDILVMTCFFYNRMEGSVWKAKGNLYQQEDWMIFNVLLHPWGAISLKEQKKALPFTAYWIMKRLEINNPPGEPAASGFLKDTLIRINKGLGRTHEEYLMNLADSFMISGDNAHAFHPNYGLI